MVQKNSLIALMVVFAVAGAGLAVLFSAETSYNDATYSEKVIERPVTSAESALQGRAAGVQIYSEGGPGSTPSIVIRGVGTAVGSSPVYVVDGVKVDDISGIDPNEIASIDILKDAASAAIYGAEAGNGVIIITTKAAKMSAESETATMTPFVVVSALVALIAAGSILLYCKKN